MGTRASGTPSDKRHRNGQRRSPAICKSRKSESDLWRGEASRQSHAPGRAGPQEQLLPRGCSGCRSPGCTRPCSGGGSNSTFQVVTFRQLRVGAPEGEGKMKVALGPTCLSRVLNAQLIVPALFYSQGRTIKELQAGESPPLA